MSNIVQKEISLPADDQGYVLLKCEHCGTFFMETAADFNDDRLLWTFCPSCGLTSDNYATDEVMELAMKVGQNIAMEMIYDKFKELERHNRKNDLITFKMGKRPRHEIVDPIHSGIEALRICRYPCCGRSAKIKPLLRMTGSYCPFCGVKNYELK